jgi:hypothetical protein
LDFYKRRSDEEDRFKYVYSVHEYITYLNKLYDDRATSLITAVSVVVAIILGVTNIVFQSSNRNFDIAIIGSTISVASLFVSLILLMMAISPRSPDPDSPIYSANIKKIGSEKFKSYIMTSSNEHIIEDLCRETYVLSCVAETKNKWIKVSIAFIAIGMISLILSLVIVFYSIK